MTLRLWVSVFVALAVLLAISTHGVASLSAAKASNQGVSTEWVAYSVAETGASFEATVPLSESAFPWLRIGNKWDYIIFNSIEMTSGVTETVMVTAAGDVYSETLSWLGTCVGGIVGVNESASSVRYRIGYLSALCATPSWYWGVHALLFRPSTFACASPYVSQTETSAYWRDPTYFYTATQTVESISDTVVVPAGLFTDTIRMSAVITQAGDPVSPPGSRLAWLHPTFGLVKMVYTHTNGSVTTVDLAAHQIADVAPVSGTIRLQGRQDHSAAYVVTGLWKGLAAAWARSDGTFTVYVQPGAGVASAAAFGYLPGTRQEIVVSSGVTTTLPPITLPGGNADGDSDIDIYDLTAIAAVFGTWQPSYSRVDINGDNVVNIFDLAMVGANFGMIGPIAW